MQEKKDGYSFIPGVSLCIIKMLFQTMNESTVFFQMDYNFQGKRIKTIINKNEASF